MGKSVIGHPKENHRGKRINKTELKDIHIRSILCDFLEILYFYLSH